MWWGKGTKNVFVCISSSLEAEEGGKTAEAGDGTCWGAMNVRAEGQDVSQEGKWQKAGICLHLERWNKSLGVYSCLFFTSRESGHERRKKYLFRSSSVCFTVHTWVHPQGSRGEYKEKHQRIKHIKNIWYNSNVLLWEGAWGLMQVGGFVLSG